MATAWGENEFGTSGFGGIVSVTVNLTGVSAVCSEGNVTTSSSNSVEVSGVSAALSLGEEFPLENQVWGGAVGWGGDNLGWGGVTYVYINVSGFTAEASVGQVRTASSNTFEVAGVAAQTALGEEFPLDNRSWGGAGWQDTNMGWGGVLAAEILQQGFALSTQVAQVSTRTVNNFPVTGIAASGLLGEEEIDAKANVHAANVTALGEVTTPSIVGTANVAVTGTQATSELGEDIARAAATTAVDGVESQMTVGTVTVTGNVLVFPTGVQVVGRVTAPLVWGLIDTEQTANWSEIAA